MEKLIEVLAMHGFAAFVWPSFGAAALILAVLAFSSLRSLRRAQHRLAQLHDVSDEA